MHSIKFDTEKFRIWKKEKMLRGYIYRRVVCGGQMKVGLIADRVSRVVTNVVVLGEW